MKRLLMLWLPLLAVFWLARAVLEAVAGRRAEPLAGLLAVAAIPALQALALGWLTRSPGPSPALALARAFRAHRTLGVLLALDLAAPALALAFPNQAWLLPALGDGLDGNPASLLAGFQALLAGGLFLHLAFRSGGGRKERLLLGGFGLALVGLAPLLAVDALSLLGESFLPAGSPLLWKLCLHTPALAALLALLFSVQERLRGSGAAPALGTATALGAAAACAWIALLLSLVASLFEESPALPLSGPVAVCALVGTTALVAAGLMAVAPAKDSSRSSV